MSEHEKAHDTGFKIVDKRRFTSAGDIRADAPAEDVRPQAATIVSAKQGPPRDARPVTAAAAREPAPVRGAAEAKGTARPATRATPPEDDSGIDFLNFIASLATSAMAAMGSLPEAQQRGMPVNLEHAREYIGVISMLQARTQGNLTASEDETLRRLVTDLRLQFMEVSKQHPAAAPRSQRR